MILGSIILVLVAAGLLVAGLVRGSDPLYYSSIVASALAAFALIVGVRQTPSGPMPRDDFDLGGVGPDPVQGESGSNRKSPRPIGRAEVPRQAGMDGEVGGGDPNLQEDLADEPAPQALTTAEAAKVAVLGTEVVVIDGRPRYHLAECLHLLGREFERLPVVEAVELGFSPCGQCEPATTLLAGTPRSY